MLKKCNISNALNFNYLDKTKLKLRKNEKKNSVFFNENTFIFKVFTMLIVFMHLAFYK